MPTSQTVDDTARDGASFGARLKRETESDHKHAETSGFVTELMAGTLDQDAYSALAMQHLAIYTTLEAAGDRLREDPVAGPFVLDHLRRVPALQADLALLLGTDWRDQLVTLPATHTYCARIDEVATMWPVGFVAHHYIRYLGDLSGGQIVSRMLRRHYDIDTPDRPGGLSFYQFDSVDKPVTFKREYHKLLDAADLSPADQDRFIAEVSLAFRLNRAVFEDLGRLRP